MQQTTSPLQKSFLQLKSSVLYAGFFSFFINLLQLISPLYMLQLYDRVLSSRSENTLILLTGIIVFLFIVLALLEIVRAKLLIRMSIKVDHALSDKVFKAIFFMAKKMPAKMSSMPLNDLASLRQFLTGNGLFAFFDTPWIVIYIFVLFLFHPWFGFFAIFAGIALFFIALANEKLTKTMLEEANQSGRNSLMFVDASLKNTEVIFSMGMYENIKALWREKYMTFLKSQIIASEQSALWSNLSKILRVLFQSLILGLGAYLAIEEKISPGMMIAGSIVMGRALAPLDLMIATWKGFVQARGAYGRLDTLLKQSETTQEPLQLPPPKGTLVLDAIVLVPPHAQEASIRGVSMHIQQGDVVGIIGPSAAGKSSLVRAILGVWPLEKGVVRLDNADIAQWDKEQLGKYIGYLPQDIELFEGTISQNIARFGELDAQKIVEAAQNAGVHEMILHLSKGYDTVIGAGGMTLSGGQRQRIALARALYDNPILVVLDEPNSNLDDSGENALVEAIKKLRSRGATVIIITHRANILHVTNKLALMQQGVVHLYGATQEVLQKIQAAQMTRTH